VSVRLAGGAMTHGCARLLALADLKIYDVDAYCLQINCLIFLTLQSK
jgi:hypothetical protein